MRVLNLYAGIGGNRKLWTDVEVTAVEYQRDIADVYQSLYPMDKVVCGDAHQYLLDHYSEFDFIWASPPCPTHSRARFARSSTVKEQKYPDMTLYQEIIFLKHYFEGKWLIENVIPYYEPLIPPKKVLQRHCFWSNFSIGSFEVEASNMENIGIDGLQEMYGFNLEGMDLDNKLKTLRNCVHPALGEYLFNCMANIRKKENTPQISMF
jgi:DNA (cytosine-5)-methyltransferase 1